MNRLTVSQIFSIQEPTPVGSKLQIENIFFTDDFIYIIDRSDPTFIKRITYKNFQTVQQIKLPQIVSESKIISLTQINGIIVLALAGQADLFYINNQRQTIRLKSHMQPINKVIRHFNCIATCSDDFTVRIWNEQKGQIVQSKVKHVYFGHTDKVNCLETDFNLLVSGSNDGTVIFWKNDQIHCQYKSSSSIVNLLKCSQSDQLIIFSQNGEISIINLNSTLKNKKVKVLRNIKYAGGKTKQLFENCFQIDDSFMLFTDQKSIVFAQINLGEIINKKQLVQTAECIVGVKCVGRMLIYGKLHGNLYLLRF